MINTLQINSSQINNISMVHLNIRSLPEHFIELTAYIDNLDFQYDTNYIIPNYSIKRDHGVNKHGGGVGLYVHSNLQYKLRNYSETINSVFVEIDKNAADTSRKLITVLPRV